MLLDSEFIQGKGEKKPALKGLRVAHWVVDHLATGVFTYLALRIAFQVSQRFAPFEDGSAALPIIYLTVRWLYYFLSEKSTGRTFGKILTGCKVSTPSGIPLSTAHIALRTSLRFIPLYPLWFALGWRAHDRLADCDVYCQ
jgi:uncharacterized RDD family membrane protein YckC